ncbi:hypothetical protein PCANC_11502 [Puccinia coronata f. sp. avenae]|uniref:Uncharacterized protein n=1 Tax=Puccinia coronata f. sp. avenae TaxID=200324 RepID=A0A2N5UHV2_9BASI|nr:hypothetical protein PCASD_09643 [Puccinia coronata f. sp. avenae]PLW41794.1 hypothetical protein PCANC_11502 [Puccinia coronata f. sp. avenae]
MEVATNCKRKGQNSTNPNNPPLPHQHHPSPKSPPSCNSHSSIAGRPFFPTSHLNHPQATSCAGPLPLSIKYSSLQKSANLTEKTPAPLLRAPSEANSTGKNPDQLLKTSEAEATGACK